MSRRTSLPVWARSGAVKDPDLDPTHPGGTGGPGKYEKGWIVEKEPHQWSNFIYQEQTQFLADIARQGTYAAGYIRAKPWAVGWLNGKQMVFRGGVWEESFGNLSPTELTDLINSESSKLTSHAAITMAHSLTAAQVGTYTKTEVNNSAPVLGVPAHIARVDNPHVETAAQIGTLPTSGGAFTGEVTIPSIKLPNNAKVTQATLTYGTGEFKLDETIYPVKFKSPYNGNIYEAVISEETFPLIKTKYNPEYTVPEPSAVWLFNREGYSTLGYGDFAYDQLAGAPLSITTTGMMIDAASTYLLDDLAFLSQGGTCAYILDGVFKVFTGVSTIRDLKAFVGSGKRVRNVQIWSTILTPKQIAHIKCPTNTIPAQGFSSGFSDGFTIG